MPILVAEEALKHHTGTFKILPLSLPLVHHPRLAHLSLEDVRTEDSGVSEHEVGPARLGTLDRLYSG